MLAGTGGHPTIERAHLGRGRRHRNMESVGWGWGWGRDVKEGAAGSGVTTSSMYCESARSKQVQATHERYPRQSDFTDMKATG